MLSQGRSGQDQVFSLSDGILHIEVDRPTYELMGLEGKAIPDEGRKHVKARFGITSWQHLHLQTVLLRGVYSNRY